MKKILMIALVSILAFACKKEVKIEKNLWKKGGEWTISKMTYATTYQGQQLGAGAYTNAGMLTFNEGGTGTYVFKQDGNNETGIFTYSNTETQMKLKFDSDPEITFDMTWEKDKVSLVGETYTDNGFFTTTTKYTYDLVKN